MRADEYYLYTPPYVKKFCACAAVYYFRPREKAYYHIRPYIRDIINKPARFILDKCAHADNIILQRPRKNILLRTRALPRIFKSARPPFSFNVRAAIYGIAVMRAQRRLIYCEYYAAYGKYKISCMKERYQYP